MHGTPSTSGAPPNTDGVSCTTEGESSGTHTPVKRSSDSPAGHFAESTDCGDNTATHEMMMAATVAATPKTSITRRITWGWVALVHMWPHLSVSAVETANSL